MKTAGLIVLIGAYFTNAQSLKQANIPFEINEIGHIVFNGTIKTTNSELPVKIMLDTGSESTIIDPVLATKLGIRKHGNVTVNGQQSDAFSTEPFSILIASTEKKISNPISLDLEKNFGRYSDEPASILLGVDAFMGSTLLICFQDKQLILNQKLPPDFKLIPSRWRKNGLFEIQYQSNGSDKFGLFDTGSSLGLLEFHLPSQSPKEKNRLPIVDVNKTREFVQSDQPEIMIGNFIIKKFTSAHNTDPTTGNQLGMECISSQNYYIDFTSHTVYQGKSEFMFEYDIRQSDIITYWDRLDSRALVIDRINPISSYARCGLQSGDRILSYNDLRGAEVTRRSFMQSVKSGKLKSVVIQRGQNTIEIQFPCR